MRKTPVHLEVFVFVCVHVVKLGVRFIGKDARNVVYILFTKHFHFSPLSYTVMMYLLSSLWWDGAIGFDLAN